MLDAAYGVSLAYSSVYTIYLLFVFFTRFVIFSHARVQFEEILD